ncbi:hypothetical protein [Burkholderia ubonensis]|uniref:hypothetical protein n=1 Tax=Burkholderia ubonensis TaxID=101571 RepID=UPI0012F9C524|nr:hypothetical protein [Burkholderia ubonensis]
MNLIASSGTGATQHPHIRSAPVPAMQSAFEPEQPMPPEAENEIIVSRSVRSLMLRAPESQTFTLFNDVDKEYRCFAPEIDFFTLLLLSYCAKSCRCNGIASFRSTGWG